MPNRTIYVADADVPLFEKAQALAGGNLSAAIAEAIRRFVEKQESKSGGFEEVTVQVGKIAHTHKRFQGRVLAKGRASTPDHARKVFYTVYLTPKGNLVAYTRNTPDPNYWLGSKRKQKEWNSKEWNAEDWSKWSATEWSGWSDENEFRLDIYGSLEELEHNVPSELYEAVAQALRGDPDGVEVLDI